MTAAEAPAVADLVTRAFQHNIAPHYSPEGRATFLAYADAAALRDRLGNSHFVLVAVCEQQLIGMIEVRSNEHVAMLFVDPRYQRQGIGRELVKRGIAAARQANPDLKQVTVNSSPNSITAYQRFGFQAVGPLRQQHGIVFMPMALPVDNAPDR